MRKAQQMVQSDSSGKASREAYYRLGRHRFIDVVMLAHARGVIDDTHYRDQLKLASSWTPPANPFTGQKFLEAGLTAGPHIGGLIEKAERQWIDADFAEGDTPDVIINALVEKYHAH